MRHLLVTNDFPPKTGGIQSYLWELWRRLPPDDVAVLTTPHPGAAVWDAEQPFRVERTSEPVLLPQPWLGRRIDRLAAEHRADLVLLDPALPVGLLGPYLARPYGLVLHGAEITVPGRLPGPHLLLRRTLRRATVVVAAGGYPLAEAERAAGRALPAVLVPPGVDTDRFRPVTADQRHAARGRLDLPHDAPLVVCVSRLVPRKGMDVLIDAMGPLGDLVAGAHLAIAGAGRDRERLGRRAAGRPVSFLGRVGEDDLPDLYACADVFAMLCRNRWGGLEQEGFGIVFLEAAACGVPQLAGASGGAAEAVVDGVTGYVLDDPTDAAGAARLLARLLGGEAAGFGEAARSRAVADHDYDVLAERLREGLERSA